MQGIQLMNDTFESPIRIELGELPTAIEVRELENEYSLSNVSFRVCLAWMSEFKLHSRNFDLTGPYQYPLHWTVRSLWNGVKAAEKNGSAKIKLFHQEYPNANLSHHVLGISEDGATEFRWSEALPDKPRFLGTANHAQFHIDFESLKLAFAEQKIDT